MQSITPIVSNNTSLKDFSECDRVSTEVDATISNLSGEIIEFRGFSIETTKERNIYISTAGFNTVVRACRGIKEIIIRRNSLNVGSKNHLCEIIINGWCGFYFNLNMVLINDARIFIEQILLTTLNKFEHSVKAINSDALLNVDKSDFDECFYFPIPKRRIDGDDIDMSVVYTYPDVDINELRLSYFPSDIVHITPDSLSMDDKKSLFNNINIAFKSYEKYLDKPYRRYETFEEFIGCLTDKGSKWLIIKRAGKFIGGLRYRVPVNSKLFYFGTLWVLPEEQNYGFGSELIYKVEEEAKNQGMEGMHINVFNIPPLIDFYKDKHSYKVTENSSSMIKLFKI